MPIQFGIWKVGQTLESVKTSTVASEHRLEDLLADDITAIDPGLMLIGRQVPTAFGKFIDLLAMDVAGNLVVIELKRDKTPREVVAQVIDYASWVVTLQDDDIAGIYSSYLDKYSPKDSGTSLDEAFCSRFQVKEMPDSLNEDHEMVVVASSLDASTERIIGYLTETYGVSINAVFFQFFRDGDQEYFGRAWLIDPVVVDAKVGEIKTDLPWNGEYYISFGVDGERDWEEARKFGFISAGGGSWYTNTLNMLDKGSRVWVNVPGTGYVGVGRVVEPPLPVDDFLVDDGSGNCVPIGEVAPIAAKMRTYAADPDKAEFLVRVEWIKTVDIEDAFHEKGFFGNQNSAARPRAKRWRHTVERLRKRFEISD